MIHTETTKKQLMRRGAKASVAVALVLITAKVWAYAETNSVSMLGSLADSALDFIVSIVNLLAIRTALLPADKGHRFGHGKAEAIAGLFQTSLILVSAAYLGWRSFNQIDNPVPLEHGFVGVVVSIFAIMVTLCLVTYQKHIVNTTGSVAISADRLHYLGDVMLNLAVIAALLLATGANFPEADGIFGIAIAAYIAFSAWAIAKDSVDILMDKELCAADREQIFNLVMENPDVKGMHDLKTRKSGLTCFVQLHIELDPDLNLTEAHAIADEVEATIGEAFPTAEIIIHTDPLGLEDTDTTDELEPET